MKTERNSLLQKVEDAQAELSKINDQKTNELLIQVKAQFKRMESDFNELKSSTDADKVNAGAQPPANYNKVF